MNFIEQFITSFIGRFSNDIEIQLNPDVVTFYCENKIVQAKPILFLESVADKPKVLGWGDGLTPADSHIRIKVFDFNDVESKSSLSPEQCLTAFFRIGISKLVVGRTFIRPKITVRNIDSLTELLSENRKSIVGKSLSDSGARECIFI